MITVTATEARKQLDRLIAEVTESHQPVRISGKKGDVVLLSEEDWRSVQETLYLLSVPGMRGSIREGLETAIEKCARRPGW